MILSSDESSSRHSIRVVTGLDPGGIDPQHAARAVRFEVNPRHELLAQEKGVNVVTVDSLGLGHVDLNPIDEVEQALEKPARARRSSNRRGSAGRGR